jgi:hypothetical protein
MANGYSKSPKLLKGALVELSEPFLGPVPNIIVFQYNPETMIREMKPWSPGAGSGGAGSGEQGQCSEESTAQPNDPCEKFTLTLELDATDALEEPESHPVAVISGVADRIAAIEMLLYPTSNGLVSKLFGSLGGLLDAVPRSEVPIVLFVWGPGRILPVRLTGFRVEEQAYSPTLYPIRASISVGLLVLTADSIRGVKKKLTATEQLAVTAYEFTKNQKELLARANLANSVESILGMLPF